MKNWQSALQVILGLALLTLLAAIVVTLFRALSTRQGPVPLALSTTVAGHPEPGLLTPTAPGHSVAYPPPNPSPFSTWAPPTLTAAIATSLAQEATRSAEATATVAAILGQTHVAPSHPRTGPQTIIDPGGRFTLELPVGWRAWLSRNITILNYNDENLGGDAGFPPNGIKIEIGGGDLPAGLELNQWLKDRVARETSPIDNFPPQVASELSSYQLGRYAGVAYSLSGPPEVFQIILPGEAGRLIGIQVMPADAPVFSDAIKLLTSLDILETR